MKTSDWIALAAVVCFAVGFGMIYLPLALIFLGVVLGLIAFNSVETTP